MQDENIHSTNARLYGTWCHKDAGFFRSPGVVKVRKLENWLRGLKPVNSSHSMRGNGAAEISRCGERSGSQWTEMRHVYFTSLHLHFQIPPIWILCQVRYPMHCDRKKIHFKYFTGNSLFEIGTLMAVCCSLS